MKRLLALLALCVSSVMAQQVVDTDIVHFLQTTEKCISYDETGAGATVAVFIDDDCDNVRDATEMYLSQEASFIWLNDHTFFPASDQVSVTIRPSSSLSVEDLIQMFDVVGDESFSVSADGNTDLGSPPASDARLNIQVGGTVIAALDPDEIGSPFLWFRADDVTGCDTGEECFATGACEFRDFGSATDNCYGALSSGEAVWRDNSLNGHDTIEPHGGDNPKLVMQTSPGSEYEMAGAFTAVVVYDATLVAQPATSSEVASGEWDQTGQDAQWKVPGVSDSSVMQVSDTGSANPILSGIDNCDGTQPTCDGDPRICIVRRTFPANTIDGYCTLDSSGQPISYGSTSTSLGTVILQSLLTRSTLEWAPANFRLAEFILYKGTSISDLERDQLYQGLAVKYGLDQIPAGGGASGGGGGDLVAGYSSADTRVFRVDSTGQVLTGDTDITSAGARLHVRDDATPQVRVESDATNFCTWAVSAGGDLTIDCSGNNVTIEGVDFTTLDDPQYLVSVAANPPLANADVVAQGTGIAYTNGTNTATFALRYTDTTSSNTLVVRECEFTTSSPAAPGTNGGGFICEGNTANANEALHLFPNKDPADGSVYWIVEAEDISADDEVPVAVSNESSVWTPMTDSNGTAQCLQYDTATNAFSTGTNAPVNAEYVVTELNATLSAEVAPTGDDQTIVSSSSTAGVWTTIQDSDGATQKLQYDQGTNAFIAGTDDDTPDAIDYTNLTGGTGITNSPTGTINFDATELTTVTWGASNFTTHVFSGAGAIDITQDYATTNTMKVQQSDPGAAGPLLWLQQISASPAANDIVGEIDFVGRDTGPADQTYATIKGQIDTATGGGASETGTLKLGVVTAGTVADEVSLDGTSLSPTTNDGNALGTSSLRWSDLFLASGGILDFNAGDCTVTHAAGVISFGGNCAWDFGGAGPEFLEIPNGTAPDVTGATGRCALDTTDSGQSGTQLICRDDGGDKIYADVYLEKTWIEDIISTDDTIGAFLPSFAATVVGLGCVCDNTGVTWTTLPDIVLEDGDANAMTGTATCVIRTSDATFASITDNSASQLGVGEATYAKVNNTPASSPAGAGDCMITVVYRVTRR